MRHIIIACLLSACAAYPAVQWPPGTGATPALLPLGDLQASPAELRGADVSLSVKAADLQAWSDTVTP
jgi:hypothetical protein